MGLEGGSEVDIWQGEERSVRQAGPRCEGGERRGGGECIKGEKEGGGGEGQMYGRGGTSHNGKPGL